MHWHVPDIVKYGSQAKQKVRLLDVKESRCRTRSALGDGI